VTLPWVRLDSNFYTHDKVLWLTTQRDGYRAISVYVFSIGYAGGHATDGFIPKHVLPIIQGTDRVAQMLVETRLWEHAEGGYQIRNWEQRQELSVITEVKRQASKLGGRKSACKRLHGPDCGCWMTADADVLPMKRGAKS
jgi:hypothetical protein